MRIRKEQIQDNEWTETDEETLSQAWVSMDHLIDLCHIWGIREYG